MQQEVHWLALGIDGLDRLWGLNIIGWVVWLNAAHAATPSLPVAWTQHSPECPASALWAVPGMYEHVRLCKAVSINVDLKLDEPLSRFRVHHAGQLMQV